MLALSYLFSHAHSLMLRPISHALLLLDVAWCTCFFFLVYYDDSDPGQVAEEFLAAACAMARCVNLFCNVEKLLRVGFLLQQERATENGELEEPEAEHESCKKRLASLSLNTLNRYKCNYQQLLHLALGLRLLIADSGKSKELTQITRNMFKCERVERPCSWDQTLTRNPDMLQVVDSSPFNVHQRPWLIPIAPDPTLYFSDVGSLSGPASLPQVGL
ncbi:uncharacterized protein HD556DRAFT_1306616 [Suillus plorans]|uniref:Uncharacterized protein n=1 Tax=Suillus plorans TaxID=116603 RepID=A0A9P7DL49_9AGAM|nr:uncharacterized protein HD556DRAFT_1306616 [Suillus plorans]KAG1797488.1 hypothetical protein HD556DRAFT_1306616 [Suillus plorans]